MVLEVLKSKAVLLGSVSRFSVSSMLQSLQSCTHLLNAETTNFETVEKCSGELCKLCSAHHASISLERLLEEKLSGPARAELVGEEQPREVKHLQQTLITFS